MQYILFPHIAGDERRRQIDLHTCLSLAEHREGGPFAKSQRGSYFCRGRSASVFVSDMFFAVYRGCVRMPCGWRCPSAASRAHHGSGMPAFLAKCVSDRGIYRGARVRPGGQVAWRILFPHIAGGGHRRRIDVHTCLSFAEHREGGPFVKKSEGFVFLSRAERFRFCIGYVLRYLSRVRKDALRMASSISSESGLSRERDARLSCETRFRSRHLSWAREDALRMASSISSESCLSRERDARLSCEMRFRSRRLLQVHGFGREGRRCGAFFPRTSRERAPPTDRCTYLLISCRTPRGRAFREKVRGIRIPVVGGVASVFVSDMFFGAYRWRWNALRMASSINSESRLSRERGRLERTKKGVEVCTVFSLRTCHGARGRTPLRSSA